MSVVDKLINAMRFNDDEDYDEDEEGNPAPYRWIEISKPSGLPKPLEAGRVKFYRMPAQEVMEINDRYFKKVAVYTSDSKLN